MFRKCIDCLTSNQNYYYIVCLQQIGQILFKLSLKLLGPILFTIGILITILLFSSYIIIYLPCYTDNELNQPMAHINRLLHLIFCLYLYYSILYNHIKCSFTPPGHPNSCIDPGKVLGQTITGIYNGRKVYSINYKVDIAPGVSYKFCRNCECIKPPRAHHCSILNKCVFHMDHYCPWMNNCIGYYNYRYFVLFLFYVFLSTVYVMIVLRYDIVYGYDRMRESYFKSINYKLIKATMVFILTLAISSFISVGFLLGWHIYLIFTNQTTIEFYQNADTRIESSNGQSIKNPFDKGWKKNLKRVFGEVPWYKALLPIESQLLETEFPIDYIPNCVSSV